MPTYVQPVPAAPTGGVRRRFHLILPPDWAYHVPLPLILTLHGHDGDLELFNYNNTRFFELLHRRYWEDLGDPPPKFAVVCLESSHVGLREDTVSHTFWSPGGNWAAGFETFVGPFTQVDDVGYAAEVIIELSARLEATLARMEISGPALERVCLVGHSHGATMVTRLAMELPALLPPGLPLSAIAMVSGTIGGVGSQHELDTSTTTPAVERDWSPSAPFQVSVLGIVGLQDEVAPMFGVNWARANGSCSGELGCHPGLDCSDPMSVPFVAANPYKLAPAQTCYDQDLNPKPEYEQRLNPSAVVAKEETPFRYRFTYKMAAYGEAMGSTDSVVFALVTRTIRHLDGTSDCIALHHWTPVTSGAVVHAVIDPDGMHSWPDHAEPGFKFDGAVMIWDFFRDPMMWSP